MNKSDSSSLGAKETFAYSHPDYLQQLEAMKVAVETEEHMKYLLEASKMKFEVYKVQEYTRRTEMRIYFAGQVLHHKTSMRPFSHALLRKELVVQHQNAVESGFLRSRPSGRVS